MFGMTDQLRRASLSIPLNIAEGSSRSRKEFQHFLAIAKGSCFECIPIIDLALKKKLISGQTKLILYNELDIIARMLSKLISSLK